MAGQHVLRIRRSDIKDDAFVLLNIVNNGPQPLDLRLLATEGENPYVGSVKQRQISKLRATNYAGSVEEWAAILSATLLQQPPLPDLFSSSTLEGLEVIASVTDSERITIIIRKNISGITHRIGAIHLTLNEDEEIALFQWTGLAAQAGAAAQDEAAELKTRLSNQQATIDKLHAQLHELIKAKNEHEDAILEKFQRLLNSKKVKIRDQQRRLDRTSNRLISEPSPAPEAKASREAVTSRKPVASRGSKRKAKTEVETEPEPVQIEEDDSDALFKATTPEKVDETTDEEPETTTAPLQFEKAEEPPPRRELPFARRGPAAQKETPPPPKQPLRSLHDDDETGDDDDDEL